MFQGPLVIHAHQMTDEGQPYFLDASPYLSRLVKYVIVFLKLSCPFYFLSAIRSCFLSLCSPIIIICNLKYKLELNKHLLLFSNASVSSYSHFIDLFSRRGELATDYLVQIIIGWKVVGVLYNKLFFNEM